MRVERGEEGERHKVRVERGEEGERHKVRVERGEEGERDDEGEANQVVRYLKELKRERESE